MNLLVNLIRPSEKRSASLVSLKSLALIAAIIAPIVLLLCVAWAYLGYVEARSALVLFAAEWEEAEGQRDTARELRKELDRRNALQEEVSGWHDARIPWHLVLDHMQDHVPPTMQWRVLQLRTEWGLGTGNIPEMTALATLSGRCEGSDAERQVEALRRAWAAKPFMAQWTDRAVVTAFREDDTAGARREDRLFQLEITFHPRSFHATAGR